MFNKREKLIYKIETYLPQDILLLDLLHKYLTDIGARHIVKYTENLEFKVEFVISENIKDQALRGLYTIYPYENPVINIIKLEEERS